MSAAITNITWDKSIEQLNGEGQLLRQQAAAWLTDGFGTRCPDFEPTCEGCKRWAALDALFEEV